MELIIKFWLFSSLWVFIMLHCFIYHVFRSGILETLFYFNLLKIFFFQVHNLFVNTYSYINYYYSFDRPRQLNM